MKKQKKRVKNGSLANHPIVWITGFISAIIGIVVFISGRQSLINSGDLPTIANAPIIEVPWFHHAGWTNITPWNRVQQSFIPVNTVIRAVEVNIVPVNEQQEDTLTLTILANEDTGVLAQVSKTVPAGFSGWLRFDMPGQGLVVSTTSPLYMRLRDTGKVVFGWQWSDDTYPNGVYISREVKEQDKDFLFKIY